MHLLVLVYYMHINTSPLLCRPRGMLLENMKLRSHGDISWVPATTCCPFHSVVLIV